MQLKPYITFSLLIVELGNKIPVTKTNWKIIVADKEQYGFSNRLLKDVLRGGNRHPNAIKKEKTYIAWSKLSQNR